MYRGYEKNPKLLDLEDINDFTLEDYNLVPALIKEYMYGLDISDPKTGQPIGDDFYLHTIETAITKVEQKLDIAIFPRVEHEYHDYDAAEFNNFMYTHVYKRPIIQIEKYSLSMNGRDIFNYPKNWWNVYNLSGHIEVMPGPMIGGGAQHIGAMSQTGQPFPMLPNMRPGMGRSHAPQMLEVIYVAGMLPAKNATHNREWEMPSTLKQLIAKYAVREIFQMWGRLLVQPGLASSSISIDGISESMGTTQSARYSAMSAEILQINEDIDELINTLRGYFGNSMITV